MRFPEDPPLPLTPRFLLLHTLAHLLIRRLEAEAGYTAASIRERIYCAEGSAPMAGILVSVAVPDILGSLGGLAELADPGRFLQLLDQRLRPRGLVLPRPGLRRASRARDRAS